MLKYGPFATLLCCSAVLLAQDKQQNATVCPEGPRSHKLYLRHIEAKGVGYNKGYTTLEGFITPTNGWWSSFYPFADVRGHLFDDGRWAGNAGVGFRYVFASEVRGWGANIYYDFRSTKRQHYNAVSPGLEWLGSRWDFRGNAYFLVGDQKSRPFERRFDKFIGNAFTIKQKIEYGMWGGNAEVGVRIKKVGWTNFYGAAGPYYFKGKFDKNAVGAKARLEAQITDYLNIQAIGTYDRVFKGIFQGQVGLSFPFGSRAKIKKSPPCEVAYLFREKIYDYPERNEIIPVNIHKDPLFGIDPATGAPYHFLFVNNAAPAGGNGTFERPFSTATALSDAAMASAPGNIIYVFPGSGPISMGAGITMLDNQRYLGSGISHNFTTTLGRIRIPPQSPTLPVLTGGIGFITANNVEGAGFFFNSIGIAFTDPAFFPGGGPTQTNLNAHHNVFDAPGGSGFILMATDGVINITDSQFSHIAGSPILIGLPAFPTLTAFINIQNNTVGGYGNPISINPGGASSFRVQMRNNTIFGGSAAGPVVAVSFTSNGTSTLCVSVEGNEFEGGCRFTQGAGSTTFFDASKQSTNTGPFFFDPPASIGFRSCD